MDSNELKVYAKERGADLVGVAAPGRFRGVPADANPLSIFPECKSVVVLGRRVLRGSLRGVEEGTNFNSTYSTFGYRYLEDNFLSRTTYDVAIWLESKGYEGVPLFGYSPEGMPKGAAVAKGKPAPNVIVDAEYAAQAAGLENMGLGGLFITPEYGPRQRFALVLTDAELDADGMLTEPVCSGCRKCVDACPFGAIAAGKTEAFGPEGAATERAFVDYEVCRKCPNGAMGAAGHGTRPDRLAAACSRACVAAMEEAGKLTNRFEKPFRKREPWAQDMFQRPVAAESGGSAANTGCGTDYSGRAE